MIYCDYTCYMAYSDISFLSVFIIDHTQVNEHLLGIHVFKIRSNTVGHIINIKANY